MTLRDESALDHVVVCERHQVYHGAIFDIYHDEIRFASGDTAVRQWMDHDDAVAIVALRPVTLPGGHAQRDERDPSMWEILLIRQYRHAPQRIMWEIPAGLQDIAGEHPVCTAARELAEETSYRAARWYRSVAFVTSPGCSNEDLQVYLAFDVEPCEVSFVREAEEAEMTQQWVNLAQVLEAVMAADLRSPTLVAGVLAASIALQRGLAGCVDVTGELDG
ncbi:NUDIX domain-containing protein [Trueperella sp. LYQ143]|uniref:NUDIX domain-containing protein n=1 Tax=Trueperella sp. LYQ143 TaxID=3391059 RepID=UPI003982FE46